MWNWDFSYVIPTSLILIILMGYYFALPRLPIRMNHTYLAMLINEACVIFLDIVSSIADNQYRVLPKWLLILLNSAFFVTFLLRIYLFYLYTSILLKIDNNSTIKRIITGSVFGACELVVLVGMFTGSIFTIDTENGYTRGPLHFTIYICCYFYLFYNLFLLYKNQNRVRRKREKASIFYFNFILILGTIFRILLPTYLLYDTFCLMAFLIIYLSFENPEFFLERRNMAFNGRALRDYIEENKHRGKFRLLTFVIRDYHELRELYGTVQMNQGIGMISDFLKRMYPECLVFYYQSGRFILLGEQNLEWEDMHEEIRNRFRQPWRADNAELYLEVAFALINCDEGYQHSDVILNTIGVMLEKADVMGNDFNVLTDENAIQDYEDRVYIKRVMENAIDNDEVEVFLQPLIDARTRKLAGAEALARIRDSEGNIISPNDFIPIAEKNGRINILGEQIYTKVCMLFKDYDLDKMGVSFINVNLSPIQFMRSDLVDRFTSILNKYDLSAQKIHLEITEAAMIDEYQMDKQIRVMTNSGFQFVLDDYGKGYSNLTRLKKNPFINVKIDMEVVWEHCTNPDQVLPMMVSVFKSRGYGITAEGIETEEMASIMTRIGCDYLQGMLFSAPIPIDEFMGKYGADNP